ncbi:aspartic proteinase from Irpex Lacteus [Exidia glandulosa HHB12029]|uniref:Aspartic proteinase from Irpex Lacteus n=1 Tax=Exidia glandulosa HHB12029 TaxID=1314781 RepID=A0A165IF76_EXIGL|nr:aspartic proteinase from Irpex Lacteus [Exidia glandulosa HHB12029]
MSSFKASSFAEAAAVGSAHATNQAIYYLTSVSVGNPATNYQLIIDTGSANTWVGSKTAYKTTNSSVSTGARFAVNYQSSSVSGNLYMDKVALSTTLTVASQQIGIANKQTGFSGVDGVLGLGPVGLTKGTSSQGTTTTIPTITDNLYAKGVITSNVVSLSFAPTTVVGAVNGEITFGGVDTTQYTGALTYAPITAKYPASAYWGVDAAVSYGSTVFLYGHPTIVESGLTLIYLASDAFKKYQAATGGVLDSATGLLKVTAAQFNALQPLTLTIAGQKYSLNANAQIWPRTLNTAIGGQANGVYLVVADLGTPSGSGLDVIAGQVFMERFYTSFDSTNKKVGLAQTKYTSASVN